MLRSIGSVTFLALVLVGCGGGGSGDGGSGGGTAYYSIGGSVTGLTGSGLVLQNSGGADLPVGASGAFTFPTPVPSGTSYAVTVKTSPSSPAQGCLVAHGAGTVASANVTNVSVSCQDGFMVGGTVSGLVGSGLTLQTCTPRIGPHGGAPPDCTNQSPVFAAGPFSFNAVFAPSYHGWVNIAQQPTSPAQHCVINSVAVPASAGTGFTVSCTGYAYVTNSADDTLSAYSVDPTTGALKSLGSPVATGSTPSATIAIEFNDNVIGGDQPRYVYVANQGSNDVSGFAVDSSTGALSLITGSSAFPGSPWAVGTGPQAMAAFVPAQALYIANTGSDNLTVFGIDLGSGALNAPSTYPTGKGPTSLAIVPVPGLASSVLYIANNGGSNDISGYELNSMTPLPGSPFPAGGNPLSLAIGAGGKFLYSANPGHPRATPSTLSGFSIDPSTGTLSPLSGSPFALPANHYISTDQTGAYLYITSGDGIVGYAINQNTGALTALAGFPVATGTPYDAYSISIDSTNQFLYVTNEAGATVSGFRLDAATGGLTPMAAPFPAGNGPQFVATF